ncbi:tRNA 2-thiouridine(34) synthase MnmA, partial [Candidatus Saccharibacteria bacterium]|nr:tRNA 2-thiouridine(34) synthase MnmA [Candidatus Saccharibacteria bacterium]
VRVRHRAPLVLAMLQFERAGVVLQLPEPQRAVAAGQSIVIYRDGVCLGGGVVA